MVGAIPGFRVQGLHVATESDMEQVGFGLTVRRQSAGAESKSGLLGEEVGTWIGDD